MDILNGLKKHINNEKASFHMPGHKNGAAFFGTPLYNNIFALDTTELCGTDCLFSPADFILEAEKKAALIYHSAHAHFLVNGSTSGILSMFYCSFLPGDKVIVDRNCHMSAISAISLSGVTPIYVTPEINEEIGCPDKILPKKIEALFNEHKNIKGVYITSPNYYGIVSDIEKIAEIAHKNNAVLLVDEAHGAHFPFSSHFPKNAIASGADLSVVSLHKSLAAPNQAALMLRGNCKISDSALKEAINIFTTTSPSYIILAYSDAAINLAKENGEAMTEKFLALSDGLSHFKTDDPFKIILSYENKGFSGEELDKFLQEKYGIYCEMHDHKNVLLMASWGNRESDFSLLKTAILYLNSLPGKKYNPKEYPYFSYSKGTFLAQNFAKKDSEYVELDSACGRICAKAVTTFPPCVPLLMPGETVTKEHIDFLSGYNGKITGITCGKICVIK